MQKLREITLEALLERIVYFGGNRTKAAQSLGISIRTLRNMMRELPEEIRNSIDSSLVNRMKSLEVVHKTNLKKLHKAVQIINRLSYETNCWCYDSAGKTKMHKQHCTEIRVFISSLTN